MKLRPRRAHGISDTRMIGHSANEAAVLSAVTPATSLTCAAPLLVLGLGSPVSLPFSEDVFQRFLLEVF